MTGSAKKHSSWPGLSGPSIFFLQKKRITRINRVMAVLAGGALLAACGFHPLYGTIGADPAAQQIFASIYVEPIAHERVGYDLRNNLIDLLRAADRPQGT